MIFKTWYFRGVFKEDFELDFEGYFKGSSRGCLRGTRRGICMGTTKGTSEGISIRTWKGTCCHVKLRSGLVQVWFRLELRFNSLELDYEVARTTCLFTVRVSLSCE